MILDFLFRNSGGETRLLTSQQLADWLWSRNDTSAGINVTPERAMMFATVFACVRVLAESVGQLPLHLLEQDGKEKKKATGHPLYSVLHDAPNDYQTAQEWKEFSIASMALRGNTYHQINRVRGTVRELTPFATGSVKPKQNEDTLEVTYEITLPDGKKETLPAREVLHLKLFPFDGLLGASPVTYARESIGLGIAAEQHGASLFGNGAQPGGVLQTDQTLTPDAATRLARSWEERHSGSRNYGKIAVLEAGLKYSPIGMASTDAQWLEGRKYQRSEICGLYRVPPHLIGDLERATFSNIEHQALDFVVHGLMPYLTRIEQRISLQLLTPEERKTHYAKFNVAGLLRGDMDARSDFYTKLLQAGALSPNEIRELEDMNPREGGDLYLTPANLTTNPEQVATKKKAPDEVAQ